FSILTFTFGVRMFDNAPRDFNLKKLLIRNPVLIATAVGYIFFVSGLRLPTVLEEGVSLIGGITTPISMILLGIYLARQSIKNLDLRLLFPVALKLVLIPLVTWLALRWVVSNQLMFAVIVTLMAMPPAALAAIFAEQYGADSFSTAKFVVLGTILCVITVPVISLLL
ncbi:MAG: AEC family transporter, partial [Bacteroidales bacterium]|nr:AEC family transporter [Bacteroidales bacterium]